MKAAIYRWKVAPGDEEYFARRWHEITQDIMRDHGGGGSRLHRAENGDFVAYARWPSKEARDKAFADYSKDPNRAIPQREGKAELIEVSLARHRGRPADPGSGPARPFQIAQAARGAS